MNVSVYPPNVLNQPADLRVQHKHKQSEPIAMVDYKYQSLNIPDAVNPPEIQTHYGYYDLKPLPQSRISDFKEYKDRKYTPFSSNG